MISFFTRCCESAFAQTKALLWPINKNVWFKLFLFYVLAGGCSTGTLWRIPSAFPSVLGSTSVSSSDHTATELKEKIQQFFSSHPDLQSNFDIYKTALIDNWRELRNTIFAYVAVVMFLIFLMWFLNLWFQVRMNPVLIKVLLEKRILLATFWDETALLGRNLFRKNVGGLLLAYGPFLLVVTSLIVSIFKYRDLLKAHWFLFLLALGTSGVLMFVVGISLSLINAFFPTYVLLSGQTPAEGFSFLRKWVRENLKKVGKLLVLYWMFSLGLGLIVGIVSAVLFGPLFVVTAVIGGMMIAFLQTTSFLIKILCFGVLLGGLVLGMVFCWIVIVVPVQTLRRYLHIELVSQLLLKGPPVN